ncbi:hypothetical protein [Paenibacillus sp. sgz302251]
MKEKLNNKTNSMAPTEKEMIKHGEDMDKMKTNTEIIEKGLIPDPKQ